MITINLKPGAKRAKTGAPFAGGLSALKALPGKVKDPWPMAAVAVWVLLVGVLGFIAVTSATTLSRLDGRLNAARSENHRLHLLIADRRKAEAAKDSVLTQIATIRAVDGDRYVWPHILDEITRAMPAYTWLTDVSALAMPAPDSTSTAPPPVGVQINGRTMDIQGFTHFMRQLEDSPWLRDVTIISTGTDIDHGRAVTVFTVKASYVRRGA
ncbi:MAG TPA: PilN domain-containing protein [Gemmatimonadales bacterium]|jgi:Tfp pilus assembly protein PilN